jgi:hypothetical protein
MIARRVAWPGEREAYSGADKDRTKEREARIKRDQERF